jgi:hypothetical protein
MCYVILASLVDGGGVNSVNGVNVEDLDDDDGATE